MSPPNSPGGTWSATTRILNNLSQTATHAGFYEQPIGTVGGVASAGRYPGTRYTPGRVPPTPAALPKQFLCSAPRLVAATMNDGAPSPSAEGAGNERVQQDAKLYLLRPADPVIGEAVSTKPLRADRPQTTGCRMKAVAAPGTAGRHLLHACGTVAGPPATSPAL